MQGETIICVSTIKWDSMWRSLHQTVSRMARDNRIFFLEPGRDSNKSVTSEFVRNFSNFFEVKAEPVDDNMTLIASPSTITYARQHLPESVLQITTPAITWFNMQMMRRHIHKVIKKYDIKRPILWLYEPRNYQLIGHFDEKCAVYFNYDEFPEFLANKRVKNLMQRYDNTLTRKADVVFCTGRAQWGKRVKINPNTHFIPNAVNYELFSQATNPETTVPDDVKQITKPIIGFTGWLKYQIDIELLVKIAQTFSDCQLVLVGPNNMPDNESHQKLTQMPNVSFLGKKDLEDLPRYLKAFDVALIPYKLEGFVLSAYPLKLHEYLAAGKAIVGTDMPELRAFDETVRVAKDHAMFLTMVKEALDDNSPEVIENRQAVARENTWEKRLSLMYDVLDPLLAERT